MDKKTYTELMGKIAEGAKVDQETFDSLTAFAKKAKVKRPAKDAVIEPEAMEAQAEANEKAVQPKAKKEKGPKAKCSVTEKEDPAVGKKGCQKDSRAAGMCPAHYSRLVYRQDEERAERVREASRKYAAKVRAAKAAAKATAGK